MAATRSASLHALLNHILTVALLVAIAVVANLILSRHLDARVDLTDDGSNTLSAGTINTIQRLPDRARVRAFFTKELPPEAVPALEPALDIVAQIERASGGKVAVDYLDPSKADIALEAKKLGITPIEAQVRRKDRSESATIYFGVEIRCADRPPKVIPFVDIRNAEYELARALKAVGEEKPTTVAFLSREPAEPPQIPGVQMPPAEGRLFQGLRELLKDRYLVRDLGETKFGEPIPAEVGVLVLPRPEKLDEREVFEIDQFVMRGGRLLILADAHLYDGQFVHTAVDMGLEALLGKWGVKIPTDAVVVDQAHQIIPVPKRNPRGGMTQTLREYFPFLRVSRQTGGFSDKSPITKNLQELSLLWASPLEILADKPAGLEIEPLIQSSRAAWRTKEVENLVPDEQLERRVAEKFTSPNPAQEKLAVALVGKFPSLFAGKTPPAVTAVSTTSRPALDDSKREVLALSQETRVIVLGDSDLARNEVVMGRDRMSATFLGNVVDWLALDQDLISIRSRAQARPIRDLDGEALQSLGIEEKGSDVIDIQELIKRQQEREQKSREAKDLADAKRTRIKAANIAGPVVLLLAAGLLRLGLRRRARRLAAEASFKGM